MLLDEMYPAALAEGLQAAGIEASTVATLKLADSPDAEVFAAAVAGAYTALTENVGDFAPLIGQRAADGDAFFGIIYSANRTMPRSKATIGRYVAALTVLMDRFPDENAFMDRVEWLQPPD